MISRGPAEKSTHLPPPSTRRAITADTALSQSTHSLRPPALAAPPRRFTSARKLLHDSFGAALAGAPPHTLLLWLALALDFRECRSEAQSLIHTLLETRQPAPAALDSSSSSSSGASNDAGSKSTASGSGNSGAAAAQGVCLPAHLPNTATRELACLSGTHLA